MLYEILVQAQAPDGLVSCSAVPGSNPPNATLTVTGASEAWISWFGGTNYNMTAGNAAANYSFQGSDPHNGLVALLSSANLGTTSYAELLDGHVKDYTSIVTRFSLNLGQTPEFNTPTDRILSGYDASVGNPYLEWVLFNYGRYLLASSARGTLPANLQGLWANGYSNPWSAGEWFHVQVNHGPDHINDRLP
jgi:alpha-L-fucosidase 2